LFDCFFHNAAIVLYFVTKVNNIFYKTDKMVKLFLKSINKVKNAAQLVSECAAISHG